MRRLLYALAIMLVLLTPACNAGIKLELGTMALTTHLEVDEWAQANALKALDKLIEEVGSENDEDTAPTD